MPSPPRITARPTVPIGIYLQPGANALETVAAVDQRMQELSHHFPKGLVYAAPFDNTKFVNDSIHEVIKTFEEALLLVVAVIYLFLQNWRATLIPMLAIPVALVGTFAGMVELGLSIDLLTLFGIVLAIGLVVDDAIIILENVERVMSSQHKSPREAAIQAINDISGPVIAVTLSLCTVFIPVSFLNNRGAARRGARALSANCHDLVGFHSGLLAVGFEFRREPGQPALMSTGLTGGMLLVTILAPLFVPLFYWLVEAISVRLSQRKAHREGKIKHA
jgi:multidrug efflux pump subunit AcrB